MLNKRVVGIYVNPVSSQRETYRYVKLLYEITDSNGISQASHVFYEQDLPIIVRPLFSVLCEVYKQVVPVLVKLL